MTIKGAEKSGRTCSLRVMDTMYILQTGIDDEDGARSLARRMVEDGLAACAQVSGGGLSIYHWRGKVESAEEYYLSVKTTAGKLNDAVAWLRAHHPYDVPEILWWQVAADTDYAAWACNALARTGDE